MAKVVVSFQSVTVNDSGQPVVSYTAAVIGPPNYSYGADYVANTAQTVNQNLVAIRNKIIAQAAEQGVTLLTTDFIVFGAPS